MSELLEKFDNLGYDLLELDNLVYLSLDTGHTTTCQPNCETCKVSCSSCTESCSTGPKG